MKVSAEQLESLLAAAGDITTAQLNSLPATTRAALGDRMAAGDAIELRVRFSPEGSLELVLLGVGGEVVRIARATVAVPVPVSH